MKKILSICFLLIFVVFAGCEDEKTVLLTNEEMQLINKVGFDPDIFREVRRLTDGAAKQLVVTLSKWEENKVTPTKTTKEYNALVFKTSYDNAGELAYSLKDGFKTKGYLIFLLEGAGMFSPNDLVVLKSSNQFDILGIKETSGIEEKYSHQAVVAQLKEWNKRYQFDNLAAGTNWVAAVFPKGKGPESMFDFAKEVGEFCPYLVEEAGSVGKLAKEMKMSNTLYLEFSSY